MPGHRVSWRSVSRNVHLLNAENDEIAGAFQGGTLTWTDMVTRMDIVFETNVDDYKLLACTEAGDPRDPLHRHGPPIDIIGNTNLVPAGYYIILSPKGDPIQIPINRQMPLPRAASKPTAKPTRRMEKFIHRVRERDGRCVVTGRKAERGISFTGLQAGHIFPLAHLELWISGKWAQQLTDDDADGDINSVQNGILLDNSTLEFFDKYEIAINPNDGYKVVAFGDLPQYEGKVMYRPPNVPEKYQACRALLMNHFRMAVLLNMKAREGYPEWDEDIGEGCDEVAEISGSEQGKLRFETVIAGRLNHLLV